MKRGAPIKRQATKESHDATYPSQLVEFMMQGWQPRADVTEQEPIQGAALFAARRRALSKQFAGQAVIIPVGNDAHSHLDPSYRFRCGRDFLYLTGGTESDCVLLLEPKKRGGHRSVLFVEPGCDYSDQGFFSDRDRGALWVGARRSVAASKSYFGVDKAEPLSHFPAVLQEVAKGAYVMLCGVDKKVDALLSKPSRQQMEQDKKLMVALAEARMFKSPEEIKAIKKACAISRRGFEDIVRVMRTATNEREIEAAFIGRARREGAGVGYTTIAAGGANACVLHWNRNNARLRKKDLLLIDAGVEIDAGYTADITRALPQRGTFSKEQRLIYELVLAAQKAGIAAVRPGNDFLEPHRAAMQVLAHGLEELGILPVSAEKSLEDACGFHRRYTLHSVSHMLGLDVHDCGAARPENYRYGTLQPGMVLTVEPGLYFQPEDMTVPARWRGIGIRIEDDVAVTERGRRVLSDVPKEPDAVEEWIAQLWADAA